MDTLAVSEFEQIIQDECYFITNVDEEAPIEECIQLSPQPATHVINLDLCDSASKWDIKLYDINGSLIKNVTSREVDISHLNNGIYYMVFIDEQGRNKFSKEVIKI